MAEGLRKQGHEVLLAGKSKYIPDSISISHTEWTNRQFGQADAIIFVCACGIAVRSIAPFVKSKKTDPAVLVVDECGKYVISLLSGHLGGANELAETVARLLGALPIITTATDLHHQFAVDVFAKKNGCAIASMKAAKEFSAAMLAGESVGFYSEYDWDGELPEGMMCCKILGNNEKKNFGIAVSIKKNCRPFPETVHIIPQIVSVGIGCRKGKDVKSIEQMVRDCLKENNISREAVKNIASIDLKKEEQGILALAEKWNIPFLTYNEKELYKAKGEFSESDFVKKITGVENVCERSAVLAGGQGHLIQKKIAKDGMTVALAVEEWRISFE